MGDGDSGDGVLGSDHINYLILRYLQEAGHENAAKALYQDWHRPDEYHDPEKLPFAGQVKQFELVSIIQDGLFLDQVQAQVTKQSPRFTFADSPRRSSSLADTRQKHPPRRRSSQNANANASANANANSNARGVEHDEFPMPAPKRVRKKSTPQLNGDAMEVDSKTPNTAAGDDASGPSDTDRAMSEALDRAQSVSSPPPSRPIIETLDNGTQTDKKPKTTKSQTMYWTVEKDDANIVHALWNPRPESSRTLLAIGDVLCRFYQLPPPTEDLATNGDVTSRNVTPRNQTYNHQAYFDAEDMPPNSITSAACWHPSGRYATCSLEFRRSLNHGEESFRCMFDTEGQEGRAKRLYSDNAYIQVLQRSGPTVTGVLRYNDSGLRLMSVSMNVKRGLLEIWEASSEDPVAVKIFPSPVHDAVWASDDVIIISGNSRLESYRIEVSSDTDMAGTDANGDGDTFTTTGARNLTLLHSVETDKTWERVSYDTKLNVVAAFSTSDEAVVMFSISADNSWTPLSGFPDDTTAGKSISALAFDSARQADLDVSSAPPPRRVATAHHTGKINIYTITSDSCAHTQTLSLNKPGVIVQEAALALDWSPNAKYLSVGSEEGIKVWDPSFPYSPILEWKAEYWNQNDDDGQDGVNGGRDLDRDSGMGDSDSDVHIVNEPSLAWDSTGEKLSFAVGRKMAVVRLLS